jgi:hypothetical protein
VGLYRRKSTVVKAAQWFPGQEVPGVCVETAEEATAVVGGRGHGETRFPQTPRHYVVTAHAHSVATAHARRAYLAPGDWVLYDHGEPGLDGPLVLTDVVFRALYEPA